MSLDLNNAVDLIPSTPSMTSTVLYTVALHNCWLSAAASMSKIGYCTFIIMFYCSVIVIDASI